MKLFRIDSDQKTYYIFESSQYAATQLFVKTVYPELIDTDLSDMFYIEEITDPYIIRSL